MARRRHLKVVQSEASEAETLKHLFERAKYLVVSPGGRWTGLSLRDALYLSMSQALVFGSVNVDVRPESR